MTIGCGGVGIDLFQAVGQSVQDAGSPGVGGRGQHSQLGELGDLDGVGQHRQLVGANHFGLEVVVRADLEARGEPFGVASLRADDQYGHRALQAVGQDRGVEVPAAELVLLEFVLDLHHDGHFGLVVAFHAGEQDAVAQRDHDVGAALHRDGLAQVGALQHRLVIFRYLDTEHIGEEFGCERRAVLEQLRPGLVFGGTGMRGILHKEAASARIVGFEDGSVIRWGCP